MEGKGGEGEIHGRVRVGGQGMCVERGGLGWGSRKGRGQGRGWVGKEVGARWVKDGWGMCVEETPCIWMHRLLLGSNPVIWGYAKQQQHCNHFREH